MKNCVNEIVVAQKTLMRLKNAFSILIENELSEGGKEFNSITLNG